MIGWFRNRKKTVYVGLSGGVDSAVSAALLKLAGYRVVGAHIRISLTGYPCNAGEDRIAALKVATHLHIPFREIDLSKEYEQAVFRSMIAGYEEGETPNPDTLCNREIKFGIFYEWAIKEGADLVATGHYARTRRVGESVELFTGRDPKKDQSYFLYMVPEERLARALFPIGGLRKTTVRLIARLLRLPNAARKDSQGLCFLGATTVGDALMRESTLVPGEVLDETGAVIGTHEGAAQFTLGQRHGFTVTARTYGATPLFVIAKDVTTNTITVSPNKEPQGRGTRITLREENWLGEVPSGPCFAQYRYHQRFIPATLDCEGGSVQLLGAHNAPVGQALVLYTGERCLGGGIIAEVEILK